MKALLENTMPVQRPWKLLAIVFACMVLAFAIIKTIWTSKSDLVPIKGIVQSSETYVATVVDRRGHSSQYVELIIYLRNIEQKFIIARNIDKEYYDAEYESIRKQLNKADSATLWIKKDELKEYEPKVFQIAADNDVLLGFDQVRLSNRFHGVVLLVLGIISVLFFIFFRKIV